MDNRAKIALGFLAGTAAGTIIGILLAPEKGDVTRQNISQKAFELSDEMSDKLKKGIDKLNSFKETAFSLVNKYGESNGGSQATPNNFGGSI